MVGVKEDPSCSRAKKMLENVRIKKYEAPSINERPAMDDVLGQFSVMDFLAKNSDGATY